jgi:hypothetical protein
MESRYGRKHGSLNPGPAQEFYTTGQKMQIAENRAWDLHSQDIIVYLVTATKALSYHVM